MLRWLIGIILGEIICEYSNWQHIQRLKITILGANWQHFRLERIANVHILFCRPTCTQSIKFYWLVMKKKKLCCQFDDTIEVYFLLGINIWGLCSEWVKVKSIGTEEKASTRGRFELCAVKSIAKGQGLQIVGDYLTYSNLISACPNTNLLAYLFLKFIQL